MSAIAALLRSFNTPLQLEPLAIPALQPGQVLVQVEAAGVCGSDVHMWRGHDPRTPLPIILGHEGVGRVLEVAGARRHTSGETVAPGDRVLWERGVSCGECHACAVLGEPSLCPQRWAYGIHRGAGVPPHLNGGYASHIILSARTPLFLLSEEEDPAVFVSASCSGATAAHALELTPAHGGDTVVVFGPGPLGAYAVALAEASGAAQIVVIGGTVERLALCRPLGATLTLSRHETPPAARRKMILDLTQGCGADLVIEASGSVEAAAEGIGLLRAGGALSLVGFGAPAGDWVVPVYEEIVRRNIHVQGAWVSDARHTARAISLVRRRPEAFAALVTHRFPLAQATNALEAVADRRAMKAVLLP